MLGPNKKKVGSKRVRSKKVVVKRKCCPKNKVQNILGPKKMWVIKNLRSKKFWIQKLLVKRSGTKNLSQKKNWGPTFKVWSKLTQ